MIIDAHYHIFRQMPAKSKGMLIRDEQVYLYGEIAGRSVESFDYCCCFGIFRLVVTVQRIY